MQQITAEDGERWKKVRGLEKNRRVENAAVESGIMDRLIIRDSSDFWAMQANG